MTLEELLRSHPNGRFRLNLNVSVNGSGPLWVRIYIHPEGEDGKTLDYCVRGDELIAPNNANKKPTA